MPAADTARDQDELNLIRGTALKLIDQHQDRAVSWMEGRGLSNITLRDAIIPGIMAIAQYGGIVSPDMDESDDPWFEGPLAWRLDDLVELPEPIPCRGAQGLWLVPDELLPRVRDGFRADRQRRVPAAMP